MPSIENHPLEPGHHRVTYAPDGAKIAFHGRFDNGVPYDVTTDLDAPGGLEIVGIATRDGEQTIHFSNGASISTDGSRVKNIHTPHGQHISIHPDGRRAIMLGDGTQVYRVGASTKVVYRDGRERHFQMLNGKPVLSRDPSQGPAVVNADGTTAYFWLGEEISRPGIQFAH